MDPKNGAALQEREKREERRGKLTGLQSHSQLNKKKIKFNRRFKT